MSEKLIQEFKVIETEDGFRIEIKGDKERLRDMINFWRPGMHGWRQRGPGRDKAKRDFSRGFRGHHRHHRGFHGKSHHPDEEQAERPWAQDWDEGYV